MYPRRKVKFQNEEKPAKSKYKGEKNQICKSTKSFFVDVQHQSDVQNTIECLISLLMLPELGQH